MKEITQRQHYQPMHCFTTVTIHNFEYQLVAGIIQQLHSFEYLLVSGIIQQLHSFEY